MIKLILFGIAFVLIACMMNGPIVGPNSHSCSGLPIYSNKPCWPETIHER